MHMARCFLSGLFILFLLSTHLRASEDTIKSSQVFPIDASQHSLPLTLCSRGTSSLLKLGGVSRSMHHNKNQGEAHFVLVEKNSGSVLWKDEFSGEGICLGFNVRKRVYLIGIRKEHGIGTRLTRLLYIDEDKHVNQESIFNTREIEAFAAIPGPDLHYVALIAIDHNETSLFVLNVQKDSLKILGKAPLPPPLTQKERQFVKEHPDILEEPWEWMASFRDGYMELDPGIIVFQENTLLRVSYGVDTGYDRAGHRNIMAWDLEKN
jgi:hypothetical protein